MENKTCYLVIEDGDERDLLSTGIVETELGYQPVEATSIEGAKQRFKNEPAFKPEYIFIDWSISLLNYIKSQPHLADSKVVLYATSVTPDGIKEAEEAGAYHFVLKTTHETAMSRLLKHLFEGDKGFVLAYPSDDEDERGYLR